MQTLILKDHPILRDGEYTITETRDHRSMWEITVGTNLSGDYSTVKYYICFSDPSVVEVKFGQRTLFQKIKRNLIGK